MRGFLLSVGLILVVLLGAYLLTFLDPKAKAGQALICSESHIVGSFVANAPEGYEFKAVQPVKVEAPPFVRVEVVTSWAGGYYLNGNWEQRSSYKARFKLLESAAKVPDGYYTTYFTWPSMMKSEMTLRAERGIFKGGECVLEEKSTNASEQTASGSSD